MIYIPNDNHDPAVNLAMEEYILTSSGISEPVLFFYINAPSIIIGRHQNTLDEINIDYVRENDIQVVRRCSGGGAVYHDPGNLNYSLIHPGDTKTSGDFSTLLIPILEALHALGLPAELSGRNDLTLNGAKFSGNAYYHNHFGSVTHGTLLYDSDLQILAQALRPNPQKIQAKGIKSVLSRVCCIREALPDIDSVEALRSAIIRHFSAQGNFSTQNFTDSDRRKYTKIANERYRNDLWTYGESPAYTIRRQFHQPGGWIDFRADIRNNVINNVRFFGDYFCEGDIHELEESMKGICWEKTQIEDHLRNLKWDQYFPDYPLQSFIPKLFSE